MSRSEDSDQNAVQACRFLISGRVQGVGFRAATRREAQGLALSGHAINLPDGRVEVVAEGRRGDLLSLAGWLRQGPPFSQVSSVQREDLQVKGRSGFGVG